MATVTARKVPDADYAALVEAAAASGHSISEELRQLIAEHARRQRGRLAARQLRELRDKMNWRLPDGMTSLDLLREERESW